MKWFSLLLFGPLLALSAPRATMPATPPKMVPRLAWAHVVPWFSVKHYDVNRRDFALGMGLDQWPGTSVPMQRDHLVQCRVAAEAGVDGFAVDLLSSWSGQHWRDLLQSFYQAAADLGKQGTRFFVAPCLDGHAALGPQETAARLVLLLKAFGERPAWPKRNGRWIVWTYNGGTFSAAQWQQVLDLVERKGFPIFLVLDLNGWLHGHARLRAGSLEPAAIERLEAWSKLPAAFYVFRGEAENSPVWHAVRGVLQHPRADTRPGIHVGTVWPGYWSITYNYRAEPAGLTWLQRTLTASQASEWLCVVTWNDYGEDTLFEPSLAYGRERLALLREYLAEWHGRPATVKGPAPLVVWHPGAVHAGEELVCEAGTYRRSGTPATVVRVRLWLLDAASHPVGKPLDGVLPADPGLVFRRFAFPADLLSSDSGWVRVKAAFTVSDPDHGPKPQTTLGPPVPVWPSWYDPVLPRRGAMFGVGDGVRTDLVVRDEKTDAGVVNGLTASWPPAVGSGPLYLLQNWRLVGFHPGVGTRTMERDFSKTLSRDRPAWQVFQVVPPHRRWGFYSAFGVAPDGTRHASPFLWEPPPGGMQPDCVGIWHFDEGEGDEIADAGPYGSVGHGKGKTPPQWVRPGHRSPACLEFDGHSSYVALRPGRTPDRTFSVQAWIRLAPPTEKSPATGTRCIYTDTGGFIFAVDEKNRLFLQAHDKDARKWVRACSHTTIRPGQWTHVAGTYGNGALSVYLDGQLEDKASGTVRFQSLTTAIGCNPFGKKGGFFRGRIDEVRLDARSLAHPDSR